MADDVNNSSVRIHQALHGYSDGHRLLSSSVTLKLKDAKTVLVMSDVSGPGAIIDPDGYFTGYPLNDSGYYAFAKTWAAPEMGRPGCVWTHTLLITFGDLAQLPQMTSLLGLFRRPQGTSPLRDYDAELCLPDQSPSYSRVLRDADLDSLRRIVWALYETPRERVIASASDASADLTLRLWAQQWPRLRRSFRFCTMAFSDRSSDLGTYDLQFVPVRERLVWSRFSSARDAGKLRPPTSAWLDDAIADLNLGPKGPLRNFMRQIAGDLSTAGREAFAPLCVLHDMLGRSSEPDAIDKAVDLIEATFEHNTAKSVHNAVFLAAVNHPDVIGQRAMTFVLRHLDTLSDEDFTAISVEFAKAIWTREPLVLFRFLRGSSARRDLAERILESLSTEDLLEGIVRCPEAIEDLLVRRPALIESVNFWKRERRWDEKGLDVLAKERQTVPGALLSMIDAGRGDLAESVAFTCGSEAVLRSSAAWLKRRPTESPSESVSEWLSIGTSDRRAIAEVLRTEPPMHATALLAIARYTTPDFVPNDCGEDPWWTAVRSALIDLTEGGQQYLAAYLLARAMGYTSRNQAELIVFAFARVYFATLQSQLTSESWSLLDARLPRVWFQDWDRAQRIRRGVTDVFVDRDLSAACFARVTDDPNVLGQLVEMIARSWRGRRYLHHVRIAVQELHNREMSERVAMFEEHEDKM